MEVPVLVPPMSTVGIEDRHSHSKPADSGKRNSRSLAVERMMRRKLADRSNHRLVEDPLRNLDCMSDST